MEDTIKPKTNKAELLPKVFLNKKVLLLFIAIAVAVTAWYFITAKNQKAEGSYLTDTVKRSNITTTISASGTIEPISKVSLAFKNAEIIKDIYVKVGDSVVPGQLLAEQNTDNLEASLIQASAGLRGNVARLELLRQGSTHEELAKAEADVAMSKASYDVAKTKMENYLKLYQEGVISKSEFDNVNLEYVNAEGRLKQVESTLTTLQSGNRAEDIEAAAAQVESSDAQLKLAQNDLSGAVMYSPIAGIVSAVNGAVGQRATANNNNTSGGGFIDIISEALQVTAQVNEADIGNTAVGQTVEFTVNSFPNKTFKGVLDSISPEAYAQSNVQIYDIIIQMDQHYSELKAGMPADVTILVDKHENTLVIPKGAVSFAASQINRIQLTDAPSSGEAENPGARGDGVTMGGTAENRDSAGNAGTTVVSKEQQQFSTVLVMDSTGAPAPRRVALGLSDLSRYEVITGLQEGDTVITGTTNQTAAPTSTGNNRQGGQMMNGTPTRVMIPGGGG